MLTTSRRTETKKSLLGHDDGDKDGDSASEAGEDRAASVAMDAVLAASDDPLGL